MNQISCSEKRKDKLIKRGRGAGGGATSKHRGWGGMCCAQHGEPSTDAQPGELMDVKHNPYLWPCKSVPPRAVLIRLNTLQILRLLQPSAAGLGFLVGTQGRGLEETRLDGSQTEPD